MSYFHDDIARAIMEKAGIPFEGASYRLGLATGQPHSCTWKYAFGTNPSQQDGVVIEIGRYDTRHGVVFATYAGCSEWIMLRTIDETKIEVLNRWPWPTPINYTYYHLVSPTSVQDVAKHLSTINATYRNSVSTGVSVGLAEMQIEPILRDLRNRV